MSYTVLALLPTLSEQILRTMDLELLTKELQARSKTRPNPPLTSLNQSILSEGELPPCARSPTPSTSATSSLAESSEGNGYTEGRAQVIICAENKSLVDSPTFRDIQPLNQS